MIKFKPKLRSDDDPVRVEAENFHKAKTEFILAVAKALYLDRLVEWLNNKLK